MPRSSQLKNRGAAPRFFTLIELLVVITIIGILASILLPALAKAKRTAKLATCQNNLHNISVITTQYADDNGDMLPPFCADMYNSQYINALSSQKGYLDVLWRVMMPYGMTGSISQCPVQGRDWAPVWLKSGASRSGYFYTMVDDPYYQPYPGGLNKPYYRPRKLTQAAGTDKVSIAMDFANDPYAVALNAAGEPSSVSNHEFSNKTVESQNQLFLDGHVRLVRSPDTGKRWGLSF